MAARKNTGLGRAAREIFWRAVGLRNGSFGTGKLGDGLRGKSVNEARYKEHLRKYIEHQLANLPDKKVLGKKSGKVCSLPMKQEKRDRITKKLLR